MSGTALLLFAPLRKKIFGEMHPNESQMFYLHRRITPIALTICSFLVLAESVLGFEAICSGSADYSTPCYTNWSRKANAADDMKMDPHNNSFAPFDVDESKEWGRIYRFVVFILFAQALGFYFPWKLWLVGECYTLPNLIKSVANDEECCTVEDGTSLIEEKHRQLARKFVAEEKEHALYAVSYYFCEVLEYFVPFIEILILNRIFNGEFIDLGPKMIMRLENPMHDYDDFLSLTFPTFAICRYPTKTGQLLCNFSINVLCKKIYGCIWFWFTFVSILSCIAIAFNVANYLIPHLRDRRLINRMDPMLPGWSESDKLKLRQLLEKISHGDWMLLFGICGNVHPEKFKKFLLLIQEEMEDEDI